MPFVLQDNFDFCCALFSQLSFQCLEMWWKCLSFDILPQGEYNKHITGQIKQTTLFTCQMYLELLLREYYWFFFSFLCSYSKEACSNEILAKLYHRRVWLTICSSCLLMWHQHGGKFMELWATNYPVQIP